MRFSTSRVGVGRRASHEIINAAVTPPPPTPTPQYQRRCQHHQHQQVERSKRYGTAIYHSRRDRSVIRFEVFRGKKVREISLHAA